MTDIENHKKQFSESVETLKDSMRSYFPNGKGELSVRLLETILQQKENLARYELMSAMQKEIIKQNNQFTGGESGVSN